MDGGLQSAEQWREGRDAAPDGPAQPDVPEPLRLLAGGKLPDSDFEEFVDWAFRKNHRYGAIVCDLDRRCIVALLPDREPATVAVWLEDHSTISTLTRDRGGGYDEVMARGAPQALQMADRWHLMENASAAFLDAVRKSMSVVRKAVGATTVDPDLLTSAERLQYEGFLRREQANETILALARQDIPIKEIVRRTGHSRGLVRRVLRAGRKPTSSAAGRARSSRTCRS